MRVLDSLKNARKCGIRRTKTVAQRVMIDLGTRDPTRRRGLWATVCWGVGRDGGGGVRFWKFLSIVFYLDRWLRLQREWTAVVAREMNGDDGR